jgi:hypothetical protein
VFLDRVGSAGLVEGYDRVLVPVFWAIGPRRLPATLTPAPRDPLPR